MALCVCVWPCACVSICVHWWPLQGYTLAEEEEDSLIFQHRQLRGNKGDALVSGPVEAGPMKKLHVSTTALQKVRRDSFATVFLKSGFLTSSVDLWPVGIMCKVNNPVHKPDDIQPNNRIVIN